MVAAVPADDRHAVFGRWTWNLRFGHSALVQIQRTKRNLEGLASQLLNEFHPGSQLPEETAALLILAGQVWQEPKLTLDRVKRRLRAMNEVDRQLLTTWATADFLTAVLSLVEARVLAAVPEADDED